MTFSQKLIALRRRDGLTQTGLARSVGVTRQAVYLWEKGLSYPEAEALLALRRLFGVSIDELLVDEIELDAGLKNAAEPRREPTPKAARPSARPTEENDRKETAEPVENGRFEAGNAKTPVENVEKSDLLLDGGEEPALAAAPTPAPQNVPLRTKVEPSKKLKSGSLLDLFGAFWKRKK